MEALNSQGCRNWGINTVPPLHGVEAFPGGQGCHSSGAGPLTAAFVFPVQFSARRNRESFYPNQEAWNTLQR